MSGNAPKLHLDADSSSKALQQALLNRGHDVSRTPNDWIRTDASDEQQLTGATAHGRVIFTYNIRDFQKLAGQYPRHAGIILAAQRSFTLHDLIVLLDKVLSTTMEEEWIGQVRWLSDWL
jgi:hypothetical protein